MFLCRTVILGLMLALLSSTAWSGTVAKKAASPAQVEGSWEKVACPFDTSKALLPVTCGRLKVLENYDEPKDRSVEVAVMVVSPERKAARSPLLLTSG